MEAKGAMKDGDSITFVQLMKSRELRRPLITCLVIQITQQLCGINAVSFISKIFLILIIKINLFDYIYVINKHLDFLLLGAYIQELRN